MPGAAKTADLCYRASRAGWGVCGHGGIVGFDTTPWIEAAWAVFLVYWGASARRVRRPVRSEPLGPRLFKYWLPLAAAALLIRPVRSYPSSLLHWRFMPDAG